jgi:hypothetical protein
MGKYLMKNKNFNFILSLLLISCSSMLKERASWDFIQENDFNIGQLHKNNDAYYLSFDCDLSKYNSAPLAIIKSNANVSKIFPNEIHFYLIYTLSEKENIDEIKLGKINSGIYQIYYIDIDGTKHYIQDIIVK